MQQLPKIPRKTIDRLIAFLIGCESDAEIVSKIGYTDDKTEFWQYKLVFVPSKFFTDRYYGLPRSMPVLPMQMIGRTPILFGDPDVVKINDTVVVFADLIASTYFLLSRYEELITPDRDEHGRFIGKKSIMDGLLYRPLVDEYGKLLRRWLTDCNVEVPDPPEKIKKIYLTHDIDIPYLYRTWKQVGGAFLKRRNEILPSLKTIFGKIENDPFYTYNYIIEQNKRLAEQQDIPVETVFFLKAGKYDDPHDKPDYDLQSNEIQQIISLIKESGAKIGLHTSYTAGDVGLLALHEKEQLQKAIGEPVTYNRYHFLRTKNSQDMQYLPFSGLTDDFSVGYADVAGFRLGTCRPAPWINLKTKTVSTDLTLHPLTMMDCTLSSEKYMDLDFEWAFNYATELIYQIEKHNGELVMLWHNQTLVDDKTFNHKKFYAKLLDYIREIQ